MKPVSILVALAIQILQHPDIPRRLRNWQHQSVSGKRHFERRSQAKSSDQDLPNCHAESFALRLSVHRIEAYAPDVVIPPAIGDEIDHPSVGRPPAPGSNAATCHLRPGARRGMTYNVEAFASVALTTTKTIQRLSGEKCAWKRL